MYDKIVKIISQYEEKGDFTHPNVDDKHWVQVKMAK